VDDQREVIREALEAGQAAGKGPRATALDIAGRINRLTGKREGGLIGLTSGQARAAARARAELDALDAKYFTRGLRDKRFDPMVRRAIRDGKALSQADAQRIADRYKDRLLNFRATNIARTETLAALHAGQFEAMQQLIDTGKVTADQVTVKWSATMDSRTRDAHVHLNGETVKFGQTFVSSTGSRMRYPQDQELGAGPEDVINCRCTAIMRVKYL
jgi:hypothetical protein